MLNLGWHIVPVLDPATAFPGSHDMALVATSLLIAILAAFAKFLDTAPSPVAEIRARTEVGDAEAVLAPFGQVDTRLARQYGGIGLGLPLTKRLVELHDGTMELVSRPGEGTTVTVRLPGARVEPGAFRQAAG